MKFSGSQAKAKMTDLLLCHITTSPQRVLYRFRCI